MVNRIKHIFIVLVLPTKLVIKHSVYNIHRLTWAPMLVSAPGNCPACPCIKTTLTSSRSKTFAGTYQLTGIGIKLLFLKIILNFEHHIKTNKLSTGLISMDKRSCSITKYQLPIFMVVNNNYIIKRNVNFLIDDK